MTEHYSDKQVREAAAAFARGEVAYDETAAVSLPPAPEAEVMVPLGLRLSPDLAKRVRLAAAEDGVPYSELIRNWIEVGLTDRMAGDQTVSLSVLRQVIAHAAQSGHAA